MSKKEEVRPFAPPAAVDMQHSAFGGMKVVSVVGARPQFIKCALVSRRLRTAASLREILLHTGQHYDPDMSRIFFDELRIPEPDYHLGIGSGSHARQTGRMLMGIEEVLVKEQPEVVLVYGDTNSTLAGALAASKLNIPVAHVEAGLRSFNRTMPEEINRICTDRISALLFCPCERAVEHLRREGMVEGVHLTGDVMYDALLAHAAVAEERSCILRELGLVPQEYYLATVHRAANVVDAGRLGAILDAFEQLDAPVMFPLHPRTRKILGTRRLSNVRSLDPLGYLDMLLLLKNARSVLTDSGGMQKEAYFLRVRCVTLREETEWEETVEDGWNQLVGADTERIVQAALTDVVPMRPRQPYGDGTAHVKIVDVVRRFVEQRGG